MRGRPGNEAMLLHGLPEVIMVYININIIVKSSSQMLTKDDNSATKEIASVQIITDLHRYYLHYAYVLPLPLHMYCVTL